MKNFDIKQWKLCNSIGFINREHVKFGTTLFDIGVNLALAGLSAILVGHTMTIRGTRYDIDLTDDVERDKLAEEYEYYKTKYTKKER